VQHNILSVDEDKHLMKATSILDPKSLETRSKCYFLPSSSCMKTVISISAMKDHTLSIGLEARQAHPVISLLPHIIQEVLAGLNE
jgi:hypothetical protein